ncbi:GNAT family N-acetyltransferase [Methylobacillus arboreus]|nr:GNAT family N-acetyltransferase [Methylobacillus arboreus]
MHATASWRPMQSGDLPAIMQIAAQVHPGYPEDPDVFAERQQIYPQGCWVRQRGNRLGGYLISHPWLLGKPPALNSMLCTLPGNPSTYYLHDIALLPEARGSNAASQILSQLCTQAECAGLNTLSLIAVNHSSAFWQRQQFQHANHLVSAEKLQSYDRAACYMVRPLAPIRNPT